MLEPLGQSQVLAYLERLAPRYRIHLVSFEKKSDFADAARRAAVAERMAAANIGWTPLRYHKAPTAPATAWDVAVGTAVALRLARRHRLRIVHARSYIPALMALAVKRLLGARLLFDMRGLWADERVDAGLWPAGGRLYRMTKALERRFLLAADHVVTLTHASAAEIRRFPYMADRPIPITVIPTCADLDRFSRRENAPHDRFTYGFVGAASTWSLFDEVLASFLLLREIRPDARLLVVNRGEHGYIEQRIAASGVARALVDLVAAEHRDVPELVSRMDVAAALRKPAYSQVACAPTKLAEYLGCGVPCLVNRGIGDVAEIVEQERVGIVAEGFSREQLGTAVRGLVALAAEPEVRQRCMAAARRRFSLEAGVGAYQAIYETLLGRASGEVVP
jgi:glycosyltransferase involved in cell wall biosynthesis